MKKFFSWVILISWILLISTCFAGDYQGTLGTALTATTNPNPNTLTTVSPYPIPFVNDHVVSSAWTSQASPALVPFYGKKDVSGQSLLRLYFNPSAGNATTYTVCVYLFNGITSTWGKPNNNPCINYTGPAVDFIQNLGTSPIYINIQAISSGTLGVYFDKNVAEAL